MRKTGSGINRRGVDGMNEGMERRHFRTCNDDPAQEFSRSYSGNRCKCMKIRDLQFQDGTREFRYDRMVSQ